MQTTKTKALLRSILLTFSSLFARFAKLVSKLALWEELEASSLLKESILSLCFSTRDASALF